GESLGDRRAAHPERLHELALIEAQRLALAIDVRVGNGVLEESVGLIAQAHRVQRRECQLTGDADRLRGGHGHTHALSMMLTLSPQVITQKGIFLMISRAFPVIDISDTLYLCDPPAPHCGANRAEEPPPAPAARVARPVLDRAADQIAPI